MNDPQPRAPTPLAPLAAAPRSSAPRVFGVLSIVFGSVVFLMSLGSGCMNAVGKGQLGSMAAFGSARPAQVTAAFERFTSAIRVPTLASSVVYILMSAVLIVIGIGQLRYARWARVSSVLWGGVALAALAAITAMNFLVVRPAMVAYFEEVQRLSAGGIDRMALSWTSSLASNPVMLILSIIFYAPYPLLMLFVFASRRVRDAMSS
jgi:hypothetical protein